MRKKLNIFDLLILLTVVFCITGFTLVKAEKSGLNKVIEGKAKVHIKVFLNDINYEKDDLLSPGDLSAITIRNRPYKKLRVVSVSNKEKRSVIPTSGGNYKVIKDPNKENIKDIIVVLEDNALVTKDGYAVGGNKIKVGNHIELEGFKYRLKGKVIDIYQNDN